MKKLLRMKFMLLLCALFAGSGTMWADTKTSTLTFESACGGSGTASDGAVWTVTSDGTESNFDSTKGIHYGTSSAQVQYIKLTTSDITGTITKVVVNASTANGVSATVSVTVDGSAFGGDAKSLTSSAANYTFEGSASGEIVVTVTKPSKAAKALYVKSVAVTYTTGAVTPTCATPTFSPVAGTYTTAQNVTISTTTEGASIYYTTDGSTPTTSSSLYSSPIPVSETTTIKAIAVKENYDNSTIASATYTIVPLDHAGTEADPYTVADARNAIDAGIGVTDVYATGIVSAIVEAYSDQYSNITFDISTDGATESAQLRAYRCKGASGVDASDVKVGDAVVIKGNLTKYNDIYEFGQGCELVSKTRKNDPTFTLDPTTASLDAYSHETVDVTLTTNTDGAITCESDDENVATVALKSAGVYTITAQSEGTATITIKSALSANYAPASATVEVTVTDDRTVAGISYAETTVTTTWGADFNGQALTNENNVSVTYSSSNDDVAEVDATTGIVTIKKVGSTTIKATFDGNATYKAAVASYTLTVNKAPAGLSYDVTSFDVMLNDDSFVAPTLNNPNNLTVTYASSNENIAVVDANTGELLLETSAEGTAKITASFAGNDNYYQGSANYTINIVDPNKKGTKYNPYTVAEVIDGTATGSGIYVKGFIVGEYVGKTTNPRTSNYTTDANIAIADEFTSLPTAAASIPVQLGTDALKNAWGCSATSGALLGYQVLIKGNKDTYFTVNGIKGASEISAISVPATITAAEYATYYNAKTALDFSETGITAYTATDNEASVTLNEIAFGKVPAGTPVVLYKAGADGTAINVPAIASADAIEGTNDLRVSTGTDVENMYVLAMNPTIGFYPWVADTAPLNAGKVYLQGKASYGTRGFLGFGEETTSIDTVHSSQSIVHSYYDLQGRKVANPTKGLYIVNGKKVVVK